MSAFSASIVPGLASTVHSPPGLRMNQRLMRSASRDSKFAFKRVGVPPPTKMVSTSRGSFSAGLDLVTEGARRSAQRGDQHPPAMQSRNNRTCGAKGHMNVGRSRRASAWLGGSSARGCIQGTASISIVTTVAAAAIAAIALTAATAIAPPCSAATSTANAPWPGFVDGQPPAVVILTV